MSDPKQQTKTWKLYMSSLFARSMPYIVTGFDDGMILFTTIVPEKLQRAIVETDDAMQFVKFKKEDILTDIYEAFPLLKEASVIVNVLTISGYINKFGIEKLKLVLENQRRVRIVVQGKDDRAQLSDCECVGMLLSQYELNHYSGYYDRYVTRKTMHKYTVVISKIDDTDLTAQKAGINFIRVRSHVPGEECQEWRWFRLPLKDGKNYPSFYEYGKKTGLEHIFNAEILWRQRSVEAVICYDDDNIQVRSFCPRRLWYPIMEK